MSKLHKKQAKKDEKKYLTKGVRRDILSRLSPERGGEKGVGARDVCGYGDKVNLYSSEATAKGAASRC